MRVNAIIATFVACSSLGSAAPVPGLTFSNLFPQAIKSCVGCTSLAEEFGVETVKNTEPFIHSYEDVKEGLWKIDERLKEMEFELSTFYFNKRQIQEMRQEMEELESMKYILDSHKKVHGWFTKNQEVIKKEEEMENGKLISEMAIASNRPLLQRSRSTSALDPKKVEIVQ